MKNHALILCAALLGVLQARAQTPELALRYLAPLIEEQTKTAGDEWVRAGQGGYLLRFLLDVDNDGRPELFLSCSLEFQHLTGQWQVCSQAPDGRWKAFDKAVSLRGDELFARNSGNGLELACIHPPDRDSQRTLEPGKWVQAVERYTFAFPKVEVTEAKMTDDQLEKFKSEFNALASPPAVEGVLLADYLNNPGTAAWKKLDFRTGLLNTEGFYLSAEDQVKTSGLKDFSPAAALEKVRSSPFFTPLKAGDGRSAGPSEVPKADPKFHATRLLVGAVLAAGILALIFSRRSQG